MFPKRKPDKTKGRREGGKQRVGVLPQDENRRSALGPREPHCRKEEAITTPGKAKYGHKNITKRCPEIKPCSQSTSPFTLKNS